MMYSSMQGGHGSEANPSLEDAVLIRTDKYETGKMVVADNWRVEPPSKVSKMDVAFVRKFYAWDEEKARQYREQISGRAKCHIT